MRRRSQGQVRRVVARHVRRLREERDWSQDELAQAAGVTKQAVWQIEAQRRYISEPMAEALAEVFGVPVTALFAPLDEASEAQITPVVSAFLTNYEERLTPEERRALAAWRPPGRVPTAAAYHLYLLALRAAAAASGPSSDRMSIPMAADRPSPTRRSRTD